MKTIYIYPILLLLIGHSATAQEKASNSLIKNQKTQCENRYYYYPNLEAYFDQRHEVYIYNVKGEWIKSENLPNGYKGYSVYNKINVLVEDFDDDDPVRMLPIHKKRFPYRTKKSREVSQIDNISY